MTNTKKERLNPERIRDLLQWLFHVPLERLFGFAIGAYFSGWHYLDAYFSHFNVNSWNYAFNDYTIFLYSFFTLVEVPSVLLHSISENWMLDRVGLVVLILIVTCVNLAENLTEKFEWYHGIKNTIGRPAVAITVLACLYIFSAEAGHINACEVSLNLNNRRIRLTLTKDFEKEFKGWHSRRDHANYADQSLEELDAAARDDRLGLIWRSGTETLVLLKDDETGRSVTYRIPNKFVTLIDAKIESEESKP